VGGEKAAFKCPTDEEVQALLCRLSVAAEVKPGAGATPEQGAPGLQIEAVGSKEPEEVAPPKEPEDAVSEKTPVPAIAEEQAADETQKVTPSEAA